MTTELSRLLGNLRLSAPPPELRKKTLDAATEALFTPSTPNLWIRIFESRPLRLAWATTVVGLLLAHALLSIPPRPFTPFQPGIPLHRASRMADEEIQAIADLPRLDLEVRSLAAIVSAEPASSSTDDPPTRNHRENA